METDLSRSRVWIYVQGKWWTVLKSTTKRRLGPNDFTGEFCYTFKRKHTNFFFKKNSSKKHKMSTPCPDLSSKLVLLWYKAHTQSQVCKSYINNIDVKVFSKILGNWIGKSYHKRLSTLSKWNLLLKCKIGSTFENLLIQYRKSKE